LISVSFSPRRAGAVLRRAAASVIAVLVVSSAASRLAAQTNVPPAPPAAPAAQVEGPTFPKPDPAEFTAASPTKEQVESFLHASWGYDTNRVFQVQRITKTVVPGISNVVILVGEKGRKETGALQFFALPDGKHIIAGGSGGGAGEILPFGDHPYAENRTTLQARADGPSEGAAGKDLELVEFADFQCPHCKDAQPTVQKLLTDFPNAHFVFENYPLQQHPQAFHAAAYGVCVAKLGGNKAFFDYASAVFDGQAGLATDDGATLTLNSAVTKAGQDPEKVEACSKTPETKATVEASVKLAQDLNINQTPSLAINGRIIPFGGVEYNILKEMINYQATNDGPAK
jgi:protein-disulfide isomerase